MLFGSSAQKEQLEAIKAKIAILEQELAESRVERASLKQQVETKATKEELETGLEEARNDAARLVHATTRTSVDRERETALKMESMNAAHGALKDDVHVKNQQLSAQQKEGRGEVLARIKGVETDLEETKKTTEGAADEIAELKKEAAAQGMQMQDMSRKVHQVNEALVGVAAGSAALRTAALRRERKRTADPDVDLLTTDSDSGGSSSSSSSASSSAKRAKKSSDKKSNGKSKATSRPTGLPAGTSPSSTAAGRQDWSPRNAGTATGSTPLALPLRDGSASSSDSDYCTAPPTTVKKIKDMGLGHQAMSSSSSNSSSSSSSGVHQGGEETAAAVVAAQGRAPPLAEPRPSTPPGSASRATTPPPSKTPKLCSVPDCTKQRQCNYRCAEHSPRCSNDDCNNAIRTTKHGGLCRPCLVEFENKTVGLLEE